jgi:predicted acetyltransferase
VGHINLRVGNNKHLRRVVGHVGYWIRRRDRGHHYALLACRALAPFARTFMPEVILTCDPDNAGSRLTLQRLVGGTRGERVLVPRGDPHYRRGARTKLRFRWRP